ncbi:hypothetical protein GCM10018952_41220 [Streptosporangium vulgare]
MDIFLERLFDGVTNGAVYAIMALALVVVFRSTGTINFAQGEMALFTTYLAWWLTAAAQVPLWIAALVAAAAGFVLGAVVERTLIRPIRRRNDMASLIVALGLFTAFNALAGLLWNSETKTMPSLFPSAMDDFVSVGGRPALLGRARRLALRGRPDRRGLRALQPDPPGAAHARGGRQPRVGRAQRGADRPHPDARLGTRGRHRLPRRGAAHPALPAPAQPADDVPDPHLRLRRRPVRRAGQPGGARSWEGSASACSKR